MWHLDFTISIAIMLSFSVGVVAREFIKYVY